MVTNYKCDDSVHVIEMSAYRALEAKLTKLKFVLRNTVETETGLIAQHKEERDTVEKQNAELRGVIKEMAKEIWLDSVTYIPSELKNKVDEILYGDTK